MIRLLLVDTRSLILDGIKTILNQEPDLQVVGTANHIGDAIAQAKILQPDIVVIEAQLLADDGRTGTKVICEQFPTIKVLVLSTCADNHCVAASLQAGAKGYLLKDMVSEELIIAIRCIQRGHALFAPGLLEKALSSLMSSSSNRAQQIQFVCSELTLRQREIFHLVGTGATNREIAQQLYIAEGTVKSYITSLLSRFALKNRAQLAIYATSSFPT